MWFVLVRQLSTWEEINSQFRWRETFRRCFRSQIFWSCCRQEVGAMENAYLHTHPGVGTDWVGALARRQTTGARFQESSNTSECRHHRAQPQDIALPKATIAMSKARGGAAVDQIVKLIVGAGQASPSPPVGPALGSKGVKSMDFCKVWLRILCRLE